MYHRLIKFIKGVLPHLSIIFAVVVIVMVIADYYNPSMSFLNSLPSKVVIVTLCASAIMTAIIQVWINRRS